MNTIYISDKNNILFKFDYNEDLISKMRKIGASWDASNKFWKFPAVPSNAIKIASVSDNFTMTDKTKNVIEELAAQYEQNLTASKQATSDFQVSGLGGELRQFQKAGVEYITKNKNVLLADEMGLGKTVQALAAIHHENAYPAIVVCPATLKLNWKKETEKWLPGKTVSVIGIKKYEQETADIHIINYDIVKKHLPKLQALSAKAIIMDESHYAKNHEAQRTKALKELAKPISMKIALTGTPVLNRPKELISPLGILGRLDDMGGFWNFAKRYCGAYQGRYGWNMDGAQNLKELNEKMRSCCYVRREKSDVLKELPAKQRCIVPVEISNMREYRQTENDLTKYVMDKAAEDKTFLKSIKHLTPEEQKEKTREYKEQKAANAEQAAMLVKIEALKQMAAKGKIDAAREWMNSFAETDKSLVVFAHHKNVIDDLKTAFPDAVKITGEDNTEQRQNAVDRFQNGDAKIILCSIRAASTGITLTASSNVLFLEQDWTPSVHDQAEDRCHRMGQEDSVTAWYLLGSGTIDEDIYDLIQQKRNITTQANVGTDYENKDVSVQKELIDRLLKRNAGKEPIKMEDIEMIKQAEPNQTPERMNDLKQDTQNGTTVPNGKDEFEFYKCDEDSRLVIKHNTEDAQTNKLWICRKNDKDNVITTLCSFDETRHHRIDPDDGIIKQIKELDKEHEDFLINNPDKVKHFTKPSIYKEIYADLERRMASMPANTEQHKPVKGMRIR